MASHFLLSGNETILFSRQSEKEMISKEGERRRKERLETDWRSRPTVLRMNKGFQKKIMYRWKD